MRIVIDISAKQLKTLQLICEQRHLSRAEVIQKAIDFYIEKHAIPK